MVSPKYESTAQLYVSVRTEGAATGDLVQGTTFARQVVASYVDIVTTALVLDPVVEELGLEESSADVAAQISASSPLRYGADQHHRDRRRPQSGGGRR